MPQASEASPGREKREIAPGAALAEPGVRMNYNMRPGMGARRHNERFFTLWRPYRGAIVILIIPRVPLALHPGLSRVSPYRGMSCSLQLKEAALPQAFIIQGVALRIVLRLKAGAIVNRAFEHVRF